MFRTLTKVFTEFEDLEGWLDVDMLTLDDFP